MSHHYSGSQLGFPYGDPRLDFNDLYVFSQPDQADKSILVMNVRASYHACPGQTSSIPFVSDDIYEIRIDVNSDNAADLTYRMAFSPFSSDGQIASLTMITDESSTLESPEAELLIDNAKVSLGQEPIRLRLGSTVCLSGGEVTLSSSTLPELATSSGSPTTSSPEKTFPVSSWGLEQCLRITENRRMGSRADNYRRAAFRGRGEHCSPEPVGRGASLAIVHKSAGRLTNVELWLVAHVV